ncbi:MAG: hypothetical protein IKR40_08990 [Treponema sp.]|nr:hypothetical protein [Treponema sp.]
MKKSLSVLFATIFLTLIFASCENFLTGGEIKKKIEDQIAYANASSYTIRVTCPKSSGVIKSPLDGKINKKVTDTFTVSFDPAIEWEFVSWRVIDFSTKTELTDESYIKFASINESDTECTLVRAPSEGIELCLEPILAERPQIISYAPISVTGGVPKDSSIQVIFDYDIEPSSIYYTDDEILELENSYGEDVELLESGGNAYGYIRAGNKFFKNISITDSETGYNLNNCFKNPVFEGKRVLSILADKDNPLPDWCKVLVKFEKDFFYNSNGFYGGKDVSMAFGKKWVYTVSNQGDNDAPVTAGTFSVKLVNDTALSPVSESSLPANPWNSSAAPLLVMQGLKINLGVRDVAGGSGPTDFFTINIKKVGTYTGGNYAPYDSQPDDVIVKNVNFQSVTSETAEFNSIVDLSDLNLSSGVYRIDSFSFKDRSGNELVCTGPSTGKNYYFSHQRTGTFLMPIEDVLFISNRGTVATGKVERGEIFVGDSVQVVGMDTVINTVVTGIEMYHKMLDYAKPGDNVGLLLRGVTKDDLKRGMCVCLPNSIQNHKKFRADIYVYTRVEGGRNTPILSGYRPQFFLYTTDATGNITFGPSASGTTNDEMIMPGSNATVNVELVKGMPLEVGQTFKVREGGRNVAAGTITALLD